MAWRVELEDSSERELDRLDRQISERIARYLSGRLAQVSNPRTLGEPLKGPRFGSLWRFRVGDNRVIARIEDETVTILFVKIGHRREVYR